jgi:DNA polymerase
MWPEAESSEPFGGDAGDLLDKMLRAIRLDRKDLYLTCLMKTPPPQDSWARRDRARMLPWLERELALMRVEGVLLMGEELARCVWRTGSGYAGLRQKRQEAFGIPGAMT